MKIRNAERRRKRGRKHNEKLSKKRQLEYTLQLKENDPIGGLKRLQNENLLRSKTINYGGQKSPLFRTSNYAFGIYPGQYSMLNGRNQTRMALLPFLYLSLWILSLPP
jgi:hypothetical protein